MTSQHWQLLQWHFGTDGNFPSKLSGQGYITQKEMVATVPIKWELFALTLSQFHFAIKPLSFLDDEISCFKVEKDILRFPVCDSYFYLDRGFKG